VLRRIFGPKKDEVIRRPRKLHNKELHNLYSSSNKIRGIKSRRMRWAGNVTRMGYKGMHIEFRRESKKKKKRKGPLEDIEVVGRIILRWI
jgi:hypothetical protein